MFVSVVSLLYRNRVFRCFDLTEQTEKQAKQFDREHILLFFFRTFWVVSGCFGLFRFVSKQLVSVVSLLYRNREFRCFDWTETNRRPTKTAWKRAYFVVFFGKFRVVSVCFGLFWFVSKQFCLFCFDIGSKHRNKPTFFFWCHETNRNTTDTDLVSVCFGSNRNFFSCFQDTLLISTRKYRQDTIVS